MIRNRVWAISQILIWADKVGYSSDQTANQSVLEALVVAKLLGASGDEIREASDLYESTMTTNQRKAIQ